LYSEGFDIAFQESETSIESTIDKETKIMPADIHHLGEQSGFFAREAWLQLEIRPSFGKLKTRVIRCYRCTLCLSPPNVSVAMSKIPNSLTALLSISNRTQGSQEHPAHDSGMNGN